MSLWFFLALGAAFSEFFKDLIGKKSKGTLSSFSCAYGTILFSLPVLGFLAFKENIPQVNSVFFITLIVTATLQVIAFSSYFKAIQKGNLSLVLPLLSFTPLFFIITEPLIVGDYVNLGGLFGVLLIVVGSYCLNLDLSKESFFAPIKMLFKSRGARSMLLTSFLWSLTGALDKIGIKNSSLFFWFFCLLLLISLMFTFLLFIFNKKEIKSIKKNKKLFMSLGFLHGFSIMFHAMAIQLTLLAYVVSVKRISIIFGVLFGSFVLKEEKAVQRVFSAIIMFFGILLITLFG